MADASQSESAAGRFKAYGFDVVTIDGHDLDAIKEALDFARSNKNGKPKLIECKTTIGKGIPQVAGTASAHGEGGAKFVEESRSGLGLPDGSFYVSEAVKEFFAERNAEAANKNSQWQVNFDAWESANPDLADLLRGGIAKDVPADLSIKIPEFDTSKKIATRVAGEKVLNDIAAAMPLVTSGSADLHGSTKNYIKDGKDFTRDNADAKNILYGIREHAMGAIMNGIAYSGIFRTSGATFATFSDYMRPSVRLAALCKLPVFYIWTHDSVGVGEDGPTHQPVEITSALRCIPGLDVIRPADPEETAGAYISAINSIDNPTALILSRQGLPFIEGLTAQEKREGVLKGAYIVKKETTELETILLASGSELQLAIAAAKELGSGIRVVSVPCMEIFDRQNKDYRESLLPLKCTQRVAIEAGITGLWHKYTGLKGKVIGIDRFGLSAPGDIVMEQLGMTTDKVIEAVGEL
jgi:transketolase